jgi:hypothetical protein
MDNKKSYYEYRSIKKVYVDKDGKTKELKEIYIDDNGKKIHEKVENVLNGKKYKLLKLY